MKIDEIEINSFRGFNKLKNFSFKDKNNEASDIVLFYAPNGIGKTSLVEALEWNITGEIKRISDLLRSFNSKPKEGDLLKNKFSGEPYGSVKLSFSNGGVINRRTIKNPGMNNDYNSGKLDELQNITEEMMQFENFSSNILSQHNINEFLMSASTGNIFKAFFGLENNERDTNTYYSIKEKKKKIESAIKDKKDSLSKAKKTNKHLEKQIEELNIQSANKLEDDKEKLLKVLFEKTNFSQFEASNNSDLFSYVKSFLTSISDSIEIINSENIIDLIIRNRLSKQYEKLNKLHFNLNDELALDQESLSTHKQKLTESISYREIIFSPDYKKYKKQEASIKNKENFLLSKKDKLLSINQRLETKTSKFSSLIKRLELDSLGLLMHQITTKRNQTPDIVHIGDLNNQIALLKKHLFLDGELIKKLSLPQIKYLSHDERKRIDIGNVYENYILETEKINDLKLLLKDKENRLVKITNIQKSVEQLKLKAKTVIIDESMDSCPVCSTEFDSLDEVLRSIDSNMFEIDDEMNEELKGLRIRLASLNERNKASKENVEQHLAAKKVSLTLELNRKEVELSRLNSLNELMISGKNYNSAKFLENDTIESFVNELKNKLDERHVEKNKLNSKLERVAIKRKSFQDLLSETTNELETISLDKQVNEHLLLELKNLSILNAQKFKEFSSDQNLLLSSIQELENSIHALTQSIEIKEGKVKETQHELKSIRRDLISYGASVNNNDIRTISEKIYRLKNTYKKLKHSVKRFSLKNIFITELFISDFILKLESLSLDFSKSDMNRELTVKLQQNNDNIDKISRDLVALDKKDIDYQLAIDESIKFFKRKAETKFNKQLLNDIFRIIDPSSAFVDLDLELDMRRSSEKMHIKSMSSKGNGKSSSVLFFSEAQTNILSISLFLSNLAFVSDEYSNTLIIDDPIQSMDDINTYSFIDLCRVYTKRFNKQLVITTHDKGFFNLFKSKLPETDFSCKYFDLSLDD